MSVNIIIISIIIITTITIIIERAKLLLQSLSVQLYIYNYFILFFAFWPCSQKKKIKVYFIIQLQISEIGEKVTNLDKGNISDNVQVHYEYQ